MAGRSWFTARHAAPLLALAAAVVLALTASCGDGDHPTFADHATVQGTQHATRYAGTLRLSLAEGTQSAGGMATYVRAYDSVLGDTLAVDVDDEAQAALGWRRLTLGDIGRLNGGIALRHDAATAVVWAADTQRTSTATALLGTLTTESLTFTLTTDMGTLTFEGETR